MPQKIRILNCLFALAFVFIHSIIFSQVSYENAFPNLTFNFPVEMQASVDGSNRIFIIEQPGIIKVFPNESDISNEEVEIFLDIQTKVAYSSGQEIGLLGMAFHPQFETNGFVFLYYIDQPSNYRINISRFSISDSDPNMLDIGSELIIAQFLKNQSDSNHNGGKISFGPDGYLYASIGDGGGAGDPQVNGQNLETVFGSIIRIDVDLNGDNPIETNPEEPNWRYEIPNDNPRVNLEGLDELYAWGIRNTWKFSFDDQGTLWGADVGQNLIEEINLIEKGGNYGWNKFEANNEPSYGSNTQLVTEPDIKPLFSYDHSAGDVSITGGYFYKGNLTDIRLQGAYIYGDYASGRVWSLKYDPNLQTTTNEFLFKTNGSYISSFGEDEFGNLYFLGYASSAKIYKLTETSSISEPIEVEGVGNWKSLDNGTNGTVESLVEDNEGNIYVGGKFNIAGNIPVKNLAKYDANGNWNSMGPGPNGPIYDMAISKDGYLFIAGDFNEIGGLQVNNIAYFDGNAWQALGNGTNGPIAKIIFNTTGDKLYVGGVFTIAGDTTVNNIARWESNTWSGLTDVNTGVTGTNNEIRALTLDSGQNLYVGGNFDNAGGVLANRIAQWDGFNWKPLGDGTSGFVQALTYRDGYLFAGGNFVSAGNKTVNRISKYNLQTQVWESLGLGLSGSVYDITSHSNHIYVTGTFENASDNSNLNKIMGNIARWSNAQGWQALGPGTDVGINVRGNTLLYSESKNEMFIGGNFNQSGNINNTHNISVWYFLDSDNDGVEDTLDECQETPEGLQVLSNGCPIPSFPSDQFIISSTGTSCVGLETGKINIVSKNIGEFIAVLTRNNISESFNFNESLSLKDLASGYYELCIASSNEEYLETCSVLLIEEPLPLEVSTSIDFLNKMITLTVKGTSNYSIKLNDKKYKSNGNVMTLPLNDSVNKVLVTSNESCQGSYSETFVLEEDIAAFPNPFHNELHLDLSKINEDFIELYIYNVNGQEVYSNNNLNGGSKVIIDTNHFSNGFYILHIKMGNVNRYIKLLKS